MTACENVTLVAVKTRTQIAEYYFLWGHKAMKLVAPLTTKGMFWITTLLGYTAFLVSSASTILIHPVAWLYLFLFQIFYLWQWLSLCQQVEFWMRLQASPGWIWKLNSMNGKVSFKLRIAASFHMNANDVLHAFIVWSGLSHDENVCMAENFDF